MKSLCLIPILLVFFVTLSPSPAFACSGPAETIQKNISYAELIVKAHVVESDDADANAIVRVESYLAGTPEGEYLFVRASSPTYVYGAFEGISMGGCSGGNLPPAEGSAYFFLTKNATGIYQIIRTYAFSEAAPSLEIPVTDPNHPDGAIRTTMTEAEFLNLIAEMSGAVPQPPLAGNDLYPAKSLLTVTTSTGQYYYLPVDGTEPVEIVREDLSVERMTTWSAPYGVALQCLLPGECPELSPDGFKIIDLSSIRLQGSRSPKFVGQALLYAPTSDRVALWIDNQIVLQPLWYPRFGSYGTRSDRSTIYIQPNWGEEPPVHSAAWSPDGRWFAYSDLDGLWLKNVIAVDDPASLLIPTENDQIPTARYFSPQSHYLAYTQGEQRATLDINSGEQFPVGLVSPDDRTLLAFDLERNPTEIQICIFETGECSQDTSVNFIYKYFENSIEGLYTPLTYITHVEWADTYSFFVLACDADELMLCGVTKRGFTYYGYGVAASPSVIAVDYAYQASSDEIAYLVDGSTVIWNDQERDLSASIDGEITAIQWLPPEFYYEP